MRVTDARIGTMPHERCVGSSLHQFPKIFMLTVVSGPYLAHRSAAFTLTPTFVPLRNEALKGRGSTDVHAHPLVHCYVEPLCSNCVLPPSLHTFRMIHNQFDHLFGECQTRTIGDKCETDRHCTSFGSNHKFCMIHNL